MILLFIINIFRLIAVIAMEILQLVFGFYIIKVLIFTPICIVKRIVKRV